MRTWYLIVLLLALFAMGCDETANGCPGNGGGSDTPVTPVPGAIVLGGLGTIIVGWMHRRMR